MALHRRRLIRPGKKIPAEFFAFYKFTLQNLANKSECDCKPTFYIIYTSHLRWNIWIKKIILEPAITWKLVYLSADNFKKYLTTTRSTPEPAIRSSDTGQRVLCFDSCQLIKTLMSNMCALSVFLCSQTSKSMRLNVVRDLVKQLTGQRTASK